MFLLRFINQHDVGRVDIAVDQLLTLGDNQSTCYLAGDTQCLLRWKRPFAAYPTFDGFAVHVFHDVEETVSGVAEVKNGSNIRMAKLSRRASFANETLASGIRGKKLRIDDLKRDIAPEVGIECLVSHPHGAPAQFPRAPIRMTQHLEVLKLLSFRHGQ